MSLKAISIRMKSVSNIKKITKSMKMVSASKYTRAERELKIAKEIGKGAYVFYKSADIEGVTIKQHKLFIAMTSDKGLCGGVHSNVCKNIRKKLPPLKPDVRLFPVGEKARGILQRFEPKFISMSANNVGRKLPSFIDASKLTSAVLNSKYKYNCGEVVFNKFKNVVSYKTTYFPIFSYMTVMIAPKVSFYDIEDSVLIQNYVEFSLACIIYYAMKESNCAEHASRMTAMDAASKNAGEMLEKLTIRYNRSRQANITKELNEIISGASVVAR